MPFPSQQEVIDKLNLFKLTFVSHFQTLLNINYEQANSLLPPKRGKKTRLASAGLGLAKEVFNIVPIFGAFVSFALTFPQAGIDKKDERDKKHKAKNVSHFTTGELYESIKLILEESAEELARIYEYQIAMLADDSEVTKMAKYAAEIAISHFSHGGTESQPARAEAFDRNEILKAIVTCDKHYGLAKLKIKPTLKTISDLGLTWKVPSVFTKPAIRQVNFKTLEVSCIDKEGSKPEKYGYRAEVLKYKQEEQAYYIFIELDNASKIKQPSQLSVAKQAHYDYHKHYNKRTIYMLVGKQSLLDYAQYLAIPNAASKHLSFNEFIAKQGKRKKDILVKAVYRGSSLKKSLRLEQADFSEVDFSGIVIKKLTVIKGNFNHARFLRSHFIEVTVKNAEFKKADMRLVTLESKTSFKGANINETDFRFAQTEEDTDFSNVDTTFPPQTAYSNFDTLQKTGTSFDFKATLEAAQKQLEQTVADELKKLETNRKKSSSYENLMRVLKEQTTSDVYIKSNRYEEHIESPGGVVISGSPDDINKVKPSDELQALTLGVLKITQKNRPSNNNSAAANAVAPSSDEDITTEKEKGKNKNVFFHSGHTKKTITASGGLVVSTVTQAGEQANTGQSSADSQKKSLKR